MRAPLLLAGVLLAAIIVLLPAGCATTREVPPDFSSTRIVTSDTGMQTVVHTLSNGATLIHRRNPGSGIVAVHALLRPGAVADPPDKAGRMNLMMRLLTKGTESRSADEIAMALESIGARFGTSANYDFVSASLQSTRDDLSGSAEIMADVLLNPTFPPEEIRTERRRVLSQIRVKTDRPAGAAMRSFRRQLFAPGPYGFPLEGDPETVETLTQTDLVEAHRQLIRPAGMVFSVVGDVSFEDAAAVIEKHFGDLPPAEEPLLIASRDQSPSGGLEQIIRDVEQSFIATGFVTCPVAHPDSPAVDVLSAVLGQGMSSRLFVRLRDEQSLAYSVGATNGGYANAGFFVSYIGTAPTKVCQSLDGINEQLEILRTQPVDEEELDRAKAYLVGQYLRDHEANIRQASHLAFWHVLGLGIEYDEKYPDEIRAVTSRDVMRVANKYFTDPVTSLVRPESPEPDCLTWREPEPNWLRTGTDERALPPENPR